MTRDIRIALFLMGELVAALRANAPDAFRDLLSEGIKELGVTEVEGRRITAFLTTAFTGTRSTTVNFETGRETCGTATR